MAKQVSLQSLVWLVVCSCAAAQDSATNSQAEMGYKVTPNVIYGQGLIMVDGKKRTRDLWMDVYEPLDETRKDRPAVIMTFGGAYHRGGPRNTFDVDGVQDTSMGDYCRSFAKRGYVCFAIDYRLATENPVPTMAGWSEADLDMDSFAYVFPQVNVIRQSQGLRVLDVKNPDDVAFMRDVVMSAAEDLSSAVGYVQKNAAKYRVDTDRIVLGGFSAGAITSWNVGIGMHTEVAGVFALSGGNIGFDITKVLTAKSPPSLLFLGQNDLPQAMEAMVQMLQQYDKAKAPYTFAWVPGYGHFWPAGAASLSGDGTKMSVEARIRKFLEQTVGKE